MKALSILLIVIGAVIFVLSFVFGWKFPTIPSVVNTILWFLGVILVALGLYLGSKKKV